MIFFYLKVEFIGYGNDDMVVIYNCVFKIGSIFFVGIVYDFCKVNYFNVIYVNIFKNVYVMFLFD